MRTNNRICGETFIVGYALSRLSERLHSAMGWATWDEAYLKVSTALNEKARSIQGLRDEFDPFFDNGRLGWHKRAPLPSRIAVLHEFEGVSDEALIEIVRRILANDKEPIQEAIDAIEMPSTKSANVAERLLTGRMAEEFFQTNCGRIIKFQSSDLIDLRQAACGFDFGLQSRPDVAIEVKGLKQSTGEILFTEKEWSEANSRAGNYWLIIVGCLADEPRAKVTLDPVRGLDARVATIVSRTAVWKAQASV